MPSTSKKRSTAGRAGQDAIALLKADHKKVRQLLKQFESNATAELLGEIENELKVHTTIEEEIFYPAYRAAVQGEEDEKLYYEALEEHHVVDLVLPEIKSSSEGSEQFEAKGKVLKDIVEHHADEEEKEMFPRARKAMGASELRNLGARMQERKQELRGGAVPDIGAFQRMLKPLMGGQKAASNGGKRKRAA